MIFAVIGVMACFGTILYLQLYNALLFLGAWMSFGAIALINILMLTFLITMILMGKFGQAAPGTDEGEDQEDLEIRGPDAGKGGYEDIPDLDKNVEIYDEKILEADEEYERSTHKGSLIVVKKGTRASIAKGSLNHNALSDEVDDEERSFHYQSGNPLDNSHRSKRQRTGTELSIPLLGEIDDHDKDYAKDI